MHTKRFYNIGIPINKMNHVFAVQEKTLGCWSACIQMVMNAHNIIIGQNEISKRVCPTDYFDFPLNCAADQYEITSALNISGYDSMGTFYYVDAPLHKKMNLHHIYRSLLVGQPVIVAYKNNSMTMGHAVLITAADCAQIGQMIYVNKLYIRDPDPDPTNKFFGGRKVIDNVNEFLGSVYAYWFVDVTTIPNRNRQFNLWHNLM